MPLSAEQLEIRKTGIGSSEIAAVVGVSPYSKPIDVYARKVGLAPEMETSPAIEWGHRLEPVIAQAYADREGLSRTSLKPGMTMRHPEYSIALATPDYLRLGLDRPIRVVECKTAGIRQADRWGDEADGVPEEYVCQAQWEMLCTGLHACDLAVLIAGNDFRIYPLVADLSLQAKLLDTAQRFWADHIEKRIPPPVDGSPSYGDFLRQQFPRSGGFMRPPTQETRDLFEALRAARSAREAAEHAESIAEQRLKEIIGDADGIEGLVTWRSARGSRRTDWKAVVAELEPPAQIVAKHTTETAGSRRFLLKGDRHA